MMMMGMRAVLSLQWCLRGTMKVQMATWKKKKHHDDDGDEGCPVSAVVSQGYSRTGPGKRGGAHKSKPSPGGGERGPGLTMA